MHKTSPSSLLKLLLVALLSLGLCEPLAAGAVHVGGGQQRVRVVFEIPFNQIPEIARTADGLNVKFPNTVGRPTTITKVGLLEELVFDGRIAKIKIKGAFNERGIALANPPRYAIDIDAQANPLKPREFCPILNLSQETKAGSLFIKLKLHPHYWPEVRRSGTKLYLIFPGAFRCAQLKEQTPDYLRFEGSVALAGSTALVFNLPQSAGQFSLAKADHSLIIDLTPPGQAASLRYNLASQAYARKDLATVINLLDTEQLSPAEQILKARSLWAAAWPYGQPDQRKESLRLMSVGLKSFADDNQLRNEYIRMLIKARRLKEADKELGQIRNSSNSADVVEGLILSIALQNAQRQFQDSYADYGRLLRDYGAQSIPARLKPEFLAGMGQTYLGLNDNRRALASFRQALALNPDLTASEPEIFGRMGEAALKLGEFKPALEYYLKAVNLGEASQLGDNLIGLGDCLYNLNRATQANLIYAEVDRVAPDSGSNVIAKLREARALLDADGEDLTDETFEQVLKLYQTIEIPPAEAGGPISSLVQIRKAQLYARHANWDEAFEAYYQAWNESRKDNPVHNYAMAEAQASMLERIRELHAQRQFAAITGLYERYRHSFLKDLQDYEIIYLLAQAMEQQNQPADARSLYAAYIKQDRRNTPEALSRLYAIDLESDNLSGALGWCDAYLKRYPRGANARELSLARGELLYRLDRLDEAVTALAPLSQGRGEPSLRALSLLRDIYHASGDWQNEGRTLDRIIALGTSLNSPIIEHSLYIRAGQLQRVGDTATAKRLYLRLMQQYPASNQRWWAQYAVAGLAVNEGQTAWALSLLNQILGHTQDQLLLNATRSRLATLKLGRDVDTFRQQIKRFEGA